MFPNAVARVMRVTLVVSLLLVCDSLSLAQSTYWVDADDANALDGGPGSSTVPWKTLTYALISGVGPGDTLKVRSGIYNIDDNSEQFPLPIPHGVTIVGTNNSGGAPSATDYPCIGGDIGNENAVFEVIADGLTRGEIRIQRLRFVGEDTASTDAPSAVYVENRDGYTADVSVENCIIERSRMNASGAGEASGGNICLDLAVINCTVEPSDRGGIEMLLSDNAGNESSAANMRLVTTGSTLSLGENESALFGINYVLIGGESEVATSAIAAAAIQGNTITSEAAAPDGIASGLMLGVIVAAGSNISMIPSDLSIEGNSILWCTGDAMTFIADSLDEESSVTVQCWSVDRSKLSKNEGDGIVLDWGGADYSVYLRIIARGCLIADNGGSGLAIRNAPTVSGGQSYLTSCTVANNGEYGVKIGNAHANYWTSMQNTIVWGNSLGSSDYIDSYSDVPYMYNSDIEGLSGASGCNSPDAHGNIDVDPEFVNESAGNYHLDAAYSCLMEKGINNPYGSIGLPDQDIDRQDRILGTYTDIGIDEVPP
jgi:hypothetical protein